MSCVLHIVVECCTYLHTGHGRDRQYLVAAFEFLRAGKLIEEINQRQSVCQRITLTMHAVFMSTGNSASFCPMTVRCPSASISLACSISFKAWTMLAEGGMVTHSSFIRSSMPRDFNCTRGVVRSTRVISGGVLYGREGNVVAG